MIQWERSHWTVIFTDIKETNKINKILPNLQQKFTLKIHTLKATIPISQMSGKYTI